jgi:hypothetical protein
MSYANGAKGLKQKIAQQKLDVKLKSLTDTQREAARQHWTNWADETGALNCDCESCKIAIAVHAEDERIEAEEQAKLAAEANFFSQLPPLAVHAYTIDTKPKVSIKYIQRVVDKLVAGLAHAEISQEKAAKRSITFTVTIDGD